MPTYIIKGGKKLHGSIDVTAGKNAPIALLCASLLVRGRVTFQNMTHVEDVDRMIELLKSIGVIVTWKGASTLYVDTSGPLWMHKIDRRACEKTRASLLLLGALAAREKKYRLYKSGGCELGNRTIRPHLYALEKLGIHVVSKEAYHEVINVRLHASDIVMYESGDTPTENAIMAAVFAKGTTRITYASANYMVQDVCAFLRAAGAKIEGIGSTTLIITGVSRLEGDVAYSISPDPVDAFAWISLAIATKSRLTIRNCPVSFLGLELEKLRVMGQQCTVERVRLSKNGLGNIADLTITPSELVALPDKLYGRPYPGINIDNVPLFVPILTRAKGETLVHDWCYENRAVYYLELQKLGAKLLLLDPHRVLVSGPTSLRGSELICPPALRPAMAICIAMIAAKGTSILRGTYMLERGYERLVERLQSVGVKIERKQE